MRWIINTICFLALGACVSNPPQQQAFEGGTLEFDGNTDPRIIHTGRQGKIGTVLIDGDGVYLNQRNIRQNSDVYSGDHIRTEPGSGARVDIVGAEQGSCIIEIHDFKYGAMYGDSKRCLHNIITPHGSGRALTSPTVYHIRSQNNESAYTVLSGQLQVSLHADPSRTETLYRNQKVSLNDARMTSPRSLSPQEVNDLLRWRQNFNYSQEQVQSDTGALVGTLLEMIIRARQQRDPQKGASLDTDPRPSTPTQTRPPIEKAPVVSKAYVPNVVNRDPQDARAVLLRQGFRVKMSNPQAGQDYRVYKQNPAPKSYVNRGTSVYLQVLPLVK